MPFELPEEHLEAAAAVVSYADSLREDSFNLFLVGAFGIIIRLNFHHDEKGVLVFAMEAELVSSPVEIIGNFFGVPEKGTGRRAVGYVVACQIAKATTEPARRGLIKFFFSAESRKSQNSKCVLPSNTPGETNRLSRFFAN